MVGRDRQHKGSAGGTIHPAPADKTCKAKEGKKGFAQKDKEVAFIIGGGTSVRELLDDPALYDALHKHVLFGCNKAVEHFYCDYFVFYDQSFAAKHPKLLETFEGEGIYAPSTKFTQYRKGNVNYIKKLNNRYSFDITDGLYMGNNCGVLALSLAVALGYKDIFLLGMDCRFDEAMTRTHFHEGYQKRHDTTSESSYDAFATFFENVGGYIKDNMPDVKVYNCSTISAIDETQQYFKRVGIRNVLNGYDTIREGSISKDVCGSS